MEKKETKRYALVEYLGTVRREYSTKKEYDELLRTIEKYNNRKTHKHFYGNITSELKDGKISVIVHIYHRLSQKMGISDIDHFTEGFEEDELINYFSNVTSTKSVEPDINICYFENKDAKDETQDEVHYDRRIKYLPILYKGDLPFLDKEYIRKCLIAHARNNDYGFFKDLAKEFAPYKVVEETIEELFSIVEKCKYEGYAPTEMSNVAYKLYNNLIVERDREGRIIRLPNGAYQISRRRQRDFGFFIRDYNMIDSRRKIPTRYNKRIKLEEETKLKLTQKTKEE